MSIRARLALWGVAVAGLTLLLFGVGLERLVAHQEPRNQDRQLAGVARRAVASIAQAEPSSLSSGLAPVASDVAAGTDAFTAILAADGTLLYTSARLHGALQAVPRSFLSETKRLGSATTTVRTAGGVELRLHARRWARRDLGRSGIVLAGQSTRFAAKQVGDFRGFLIVSGLVALAIATLATWVVSGRALRPLKELAATADEIGRTGDLHRRLPAKRTKDVAGVLAESFNGMLDRRGAAQRRLEETLAAQQRFVADASHELRNPLATIRSNAGFLLERPDAGPADRADALTDIAAEGERVARLVDDLLTLARADGGQPLERRLVDLADVIDDVARNARRDGRPIRLQLDRAASVLGDPAGLRRLGGILLDNALRHGAGEVVLRLDRAGGEVVLTVSDSGGGVAEGELERIFERFYQADPARRNEGTGLGLAIARSIVDGHGGSIRAANGQAGGAVFIVRLPHAAPPPAA